MSFCDYWENKILNHIFNKAAYTAEVLEVALSTTTPDDAGNTFTEPSGNGYVRVTTAESDWATSTAGLITNANPIVFPTATGSWGTCTYFGIYAGTTLAATGILTTSKTINNGDTPSFSVGILKVYLD